jgi:diguanylate cyclase (GGDEF)-like protein
MNEDREQINLLKRQVAIQYKIALALGDASTVNAVADNLLEIICHSLGWQVGQFWIVDKTSNVFHYVKSWFSHSRYQTLENTNPETVFKMEEDVLGHIWTKKTTVWFNDLSEKSQFLYFSSFNQAGLKSCFGFPIILQDEVLGVMLFFSKKKHDNSINFLKIFSSINNQIGIFIKKKFAEENLVYLAQHDVLTGLASRTMLEDNLTLAVTNAKAQTALAAILYLDIDNFKKINDLFGHEYGDLLLKEVAARLLQCIRKDDIVARVGGDEFIILLPNVVTKKDASIVAKKILIAIQKPFILQKQACYITTSIGISIYPDSGDDPLALLKHADVAMYDAKKRLGNQYQFCRTNLVRNLTIINELHNALKKEEFVLYYQPKINLKTGKIDGCEALIRWHHPNGKIILPDKFIPLAEETNLIIPIGAWAIKTACLQHMAWQKQQLPPALVSVNVSAMQIDKSFIGFVKNTLKETGIDPTCLVLEITENILLQNTKKNISLIAALKKLGVRVSIDDFGIGNSSLDYVKRFGINRLKIDASFIADLPHDLKSRAIVLAIIKMAQALNITSIAEGVHTKGQLDFLIANDCDEAQGFYFSKPVPASKIPKLLLMPKFQLPNKKTARGKTTNKH